MAFQNSWGEFALKYTCAQGPLPQGVSRRHFVRASVGCLTSYMALDRGTKIFWNKVVRTKQTYTSRIGRVVCKGYFSVIFT